MGLKTQPVKQRRAGTRALKLRFHCAACGAAHLEPPDPNRKTPLAGQQPARISINFLRITSSLFDLKELLVSSRTSIVSRSAPCNRDNLAQSTSGQYA